MLGRPIPFVALATATCALVAACQISVRPDQAVPGRPLLDKIESRLIQDRCVGSFDRWQRTYSWGLNWWSRHHLWGSKWFGADKSVVWIRLSQAGAFEFRRGRSLRSPDQVELDFDDRNYSVVSASYDVRAEKLTIHHCGPNVGQV